MSKEQDKIDMDHLESRPLKNTITMNDSCKIGEAITIGPNAGKEVNSNSEQIAIKNKQTTKTMTNKKQGIDWPVWILVILSTAAIMYYTGN